MAFSLSEKDTISKTRNGMKTLLQEVVKGHTFETFFGDDTFTNSKTSLVISVSIDDVRALEKNFDWAKMTTIKDKKQVEVTVVDLPNGLRKTGVLSEDIDKNGAYLTINHGERLSGWDNKYIPVNAKGKAQKPKGVPGLKIRFKETLKKAGAPSGTSTKMQEITSAYIFTQALANDHRWVNAEALEADIKRGKDGNLPDIMEGKKYYPTIKKEWIHVYYKQYHKILEIFGDKHMKGFDHSEDYKVPRAKSSFMTYITGVVKDNFGFSKKDNWNPADIWGVTVAPGEVKKRIEKAVFGSKDSQTVEQLNATLRGMWNAGIVYGISLKKVSGKTADWEEYNLEKMTLEEKSNYMYDNIDITCQLKEGMSTDSIVMCTDVKSKGYKFQIRQNSKGMSNLKFESTKIGSAKARGGKAAVDQVVALLEDSQNLGKSDCTFVNEHAEYPQTDKQFTNASQNNASGKCCFTLTQWKKMFTRVERGGVETNIKSQDEFVQNIQTLYKSSASEALSKLMQLTFLDNVLKIKKKKGEDAYTEFWTDMVFLSIKKGDNFGPFGKLF